MTTVKFFKKIISLIISVALILSSIPTVFAAQTKNSKDLLLGTFSDTHYYVSDPFTYNGQVIDMVGNKGEAYYTYLEATSFVPDDHDGIINSVLESIKYEAENNGLKYAVLVGDLTVEGEYWNNISLAQKLKAFEEETGVRIFVVNGNHDINNSDGAEFSTDLKMPTRVTTAAEFAEIYWDFGYGEAYHKYKEYDAGTQGALTYSVRLKDEGYRLIMVDAGKYTADATEAGLNEHETGGAITEPQLEWILAENEDAKKCGETVLVFTHWNFSGMNFFHEKLLQGFVIDDGYKLQETFADAGMHYVFSGHQHVSDIDITYSDKGEPLYSIITPTATQFPFSYRTTLFHYNQTGDLEVTFNQYDCDEHSEVKGSSGDAYTAPYREIGFGRLYGGYLKTEQKFSRPDAAGYVLKIVNKMLSGYIDEIGKYGSILTFIKKEMNIDIKKELKSVISKAINIPAIGNITSNVLIDHIMSFLEDLDLQLMKKYIYNPAHTYEIVEKAIINLFNVKVSDVPCTKMLSKYGIGSKTGGGTLGDLLLTVFAYMYEGNEDISDDAFIKDVLSQCNSTEFIDLLFDSVKKYVVDDVVINDLLKSVDLHLDSIFISDTAKMISGYVYVFYMLLVNLVSSGIFNAGNLAEVISCLWTFLNMDFDASYKKLVETVLGTGLIDYGSDTTTLVYNLIDMFLTSSDKSAMANQLHAILDGILTDEDLDHDVTYVYSGPVKVEPSKEDMQLPTNVTISVPEDGSDGFVVTWFTKYSITGSDIEVFEKDKGSFTGVPTKTNVTSRSELSQYNIYGFDFGSFGILQNSTDIVKHTAYVSGLKAGTEYVFRVGDSSLGFWSDTCSYTTAPKDGGAFTFVHISDTDAATPEQFSGFYNTLSAVNNTIPYSSFILHTGNLTHNPQNDNEWKWAIEGASDTFTNTAFVYAAGSNDYEAAGAVTKNLSFPTAKRQASDAGVFYSFNYGGAHFMVLNTNSLSKDGTFSREQLSWFKEDIAKNSGDWNILALNGAVFGDDVNSALKNQIFSFIEDYPIDLILQGSDTAYIRTKLLTNKAEAVDVETTSVTVDGVKYPCYVNSNGTVAVISGSTGVNFDGASAKSSDYAVYSDENANFFTAVTIEGERLALRSYEVDKNGTAALIDSIALSKQHLNIMMGDIDFDGKITSADARIVLRGAVGLENLDTKRKVAADVDNNRKVDSADARKVLRVAVGLESLQTETVRMSAAELQKYNIK